MSWLTKEEGEVSLMTQCHLADFLWGLRGTDPLLNLCIFSWMGRPLPITA